MRYATIIRYSIDYTLNSGYDFDFDFFSCCSGGQGQQRKINLSPKLKQIANWVRSSAWNEIENVDILRRVTSVCTRKFCELNVVQQLGSLNKIF